MECSDTEASVAHCVFGLFGHRFRYLQRNVWDYWDETTRVWMRDTDRKKIHACIQTEFSLHVLQHAHMLQEQLGNSYTVETSYPTTFRVQRFLQLMNRLQHKSFRLGVLKELACYYSSPHGSNVCDDPPTGI